MDSQPIEENQVELSEEQKSAKKAVEANIEMEDDSIKYVLENFQKENFNAVEFVLENLTEKDMNDDAIIFKMEKQRSIEKKFDSLLRDKIHENYESLAQGMQHIEDVEGDLYFAAIESSQARSNLKDIKAEVSLALEILKNVRKRERIIKLQEIVSGLRNLFEREKLLEDSLKKGNFIEAVDNFSFISKEIEKSYSLHCLVEIKARMEKKKRKIEEKLFESLSQFTEQFELDSLRSAISSYFALDEEDVIGENFKRAYLDSLERRCRKNVLEHMRKFSGVSDQTNFTELCGYIDRDQFKMCFLKMIHDISNILYSFYQTGECLKQFAQKHRNEMEGEIKRANSEKDKSIDNSLGESNSDSISFRHHRSSIGILDFVLEHKRNKKVVWDKIQEYLKLTLSSVSLTTATIQLEEFLNILEIGNRIVAIGEHFTENAKYVLPLKKSLREKSKEYVENFHKESFEYLKLTLENELWQMLPLSPSFDCFEIKELRYIRTNSYFRSESESIILNVELENDYAEKLFSQFLDGINIFPIKSVEEEDSERKLQLKKTKKRIENETKEKKEEIDLEEDPLAALYKQEPKKAAPIVTNSSLNIARFIGKYINIMKTLPKYSLNCLNGLAELFDFYIYTVFNLFCFQAEQFYEENFDSSLFPRLRSAVVGIRERIETGKFGKFQISTTSPSHLPTFMTSNLAADGKINVKGVINVVDTVIGTNSKSKDTSDSNYSLKNSDSKKNLFNPSKLWKKEQVIKAPNLVKLKSEVDISSRKNLHGLLERCVASESLVFVVEVMKEMEMQIGLLLPEKERFRAAKFLSYVKSVTFELRSYFHKNVLPSLVVDCDIIFKGVESTKWDIKSSISTAHSTYVDNLLLHLTESDRLLKEYASGLPKYILKIIWKEVSAVTMESLLEAYCKVKKFTNAGRGQLSLDLNELKSGLESLSGIRSIPKWKFVNNWNSAFYIQNTDDFLKWMEEHPLYKLHHYISVANCGVCSTMKKKERQNFLEIIKTQFQKIQVSEKSDKVSE